MKISKIYSNKSKEFKPITFNSNQDSGLINVIYAEIKKPKAKKEDSHNLGKTTLISLIDFLLLKDIVNSKNSFFKSA